MQERLVGVLHLSCAIAADAWQASKELLIDDAGEIDEAQLTTLITRLIDQVHIIADAHMPGGGITVVLVGDIEGRAIGADPGDKGHMAGGPKGPDAIGHREDSNGAYARFRTHSQPGALSINGPFGGVAPVGRQIIVQPVPLLPGPPDAVSSQRIGAGTETERVSISSKSEMRAGNVNRRACMTGALAIGRRRRPDKSEQQDQQPETSQQQRKQRAPSTQASCHNARSARAP
jgi:hypothetical protein